MPSVVYVFERDDHPDAFPSRRRVSTDAAAAIFQAIGDLIGWSFTEAANDNAEHPAFLISFPESEATSVSFRENLATSMRKNGVRLRGEEVAATDCG